MKSFLSIARALRNVIKYAGLILIIFDIISYAVDKIEAYIIKKEPKLKNEVDRLAKEIPMQQPGEPVETLKEENQ